MSVLRNEIPHNTYEQAYGYLRDALAIVAELDPPVELAPTVLTKAIDLLSAKSISFEQAPTLMPNGLGMLGG